MGYLTQEHLGKARIWVWGKIKDRGDDLKYIFGMNYASNLLGTHLYLILTQTLPYPYTGDIGEWKLIWIELKSQNWETRHHGKHVGVFSGERNRTIF